LCLNESTRHYHTRKTLKVAEKGPKASRLGPYRRGNITLKVREVREVKGLKGESGKIREDDPNHLKLGKKGMVETEEKKVGRRRTETS